jgi:hypothetical protein
MLYSGFRGKSTKKRQQQGDDDKMEETDMVLIKRRWGQRFHNTYILKFRS